MPSANIFRFYVFRGFFPDVIKYWVEMTSWMAIFFWPLVLLISATGNESVEGGGFTWEEIVVVTVLLAMYRVFYLTMKRLIFRQLEIDLHATDIEVTYVPFLFLSRKNIRLSFSDMAACKAVIRKSRIRRDYVQIAMKNGNRYRISSDLRWFKKVVDGANFDIDSIAEAYEQYMKVS